MIRVIEPCDRDRFEEDIDSYFRLRKRVFVDRLGWEIPSSDGREIDPLDAERCVYVLDIVGGEARAGVRLMPTTGPTLLTGTFRHMVPDDFRFESPTIWELTRFCVDEGLDIYRSRYGVTKAAADLCLAVLDFGIGAGLTHYIAIFDERVRSLVQRAGFPCEIINMKPDRVCGTIYCGVWEVSEEARLRTLDLRDLVERREGRAGLVA